MGAMMAMEVAKAVLSSSPPHRVSKGTRIIPPPAPNSPLAAPAAIPLTAYFHIGFMKNPSCGRIPQEGEFYTHYSAPMRSRTT